MNHSYKSNSGSVVRTGSHSMNTCPSPPFLLPTLHNIPPQNVRTILWPTLKITASLSFHFPGALFLQLVSSSGRACVWAAGRASLASD